MNICLKNYKKSCRKYKNEDGLIDEVLYKLCSGNPGHGSKDVINAKVTIIGRTYATQVERMIPSKKPKQQGSAMKKLETFFHKNQKRIVHLLAPLKGLYKPLNEYNLEKIVKIHGKLTQLISKITRDNKSPRSFVSKYMHFHCPSVPIFDDYANKALNRALLKQWRQVSKCEAKWSPKNTNNTDQTYAEYVSRFWQLYQHIKKVRPRVKLSVRLVDCYILDSTRNHN